jgi:hypothetical protein
MMNKDSSWGYYNTWDTLFAGDINMEMRNDWASSLVFAHGDMG